MTGSRKGVLLLPGNAVFFCDKLRRYTHGSECFRPAGHQRGVGAVFATTHRNHGHTLGAAGDDAVGKSGHNPLCSSRYGLQAGGAEAVNRLCRDLNRHAGLHCRHAGKVHPLLRFGEGTANNDVFDVMRIYAGSL